MIFMFHRGFGCLQIFVLFVFFVVENQEILVPTDLGVWGWVECRLG